MIQVIIKLGNKVEASRNRCSGGSGVGLAIVKEFVEIHDGTIEMESVVGQGTSFSLRLPIFPEQD